MDDKRKCRRWTDKEKQSIRQNVERLDIRKLAKRLGRSEKATRTKIERMGIKLFEVYMWKQNEIRILKDNKKLTNKQISKLIKRTPLAIAQKRRELGSNFKREKKEFEDGSGYLRIYDGKGNRLYVHRVMAEKYFGKIRKEQPVHHINFNKKDNRKENLFVCRDKSHHGLINYSGFIILGELVKSGTIRFDKIKGVYKK